MKHKKFFNFLCFLVMILISISVLHANTDSDVRIVPVTVVVDRSFIGSHGLWKPVAKKVFSNATAVFKTEFNIVFKVEFWEKTILPKIAETENDLEFVKKNFFRPENGVLVVLSSRDYVEWSGRVDDINGSFCIIMEKTGRPGACYKLGNFL